MNVMKKIHRIGLAGLLFVVCAWCLCLAGCQQTPTGATTRPTAITATTDAEASLTAAVSAINLGMSLKAISGTTYQRDIAPIIHAAQASLRAMRADLNAGKTVDADVAGNAALAAVAQLQPYVDQANAAKAKK